MKKTYMQPATEWFEVNAIAMLAESPEGGLENGDPVVDEVPKGDDYDNFFVKSDEIFGVEW